MSQPAVPKEVDQEHHHHDRQDNEEDELEEGHNHSSHPTLFPSH